MKCPCTFESLKRQFALLAFGIAVSVMGISESNAQLVNGTLVKPGDVLLGLNYADFFNPSSIVYYYGGIRHAAVMGPNGTIIEGGVDWRVDFTNWVPWIRGNIKANASLTQFARRYNLVIVRRSNKVTGAAMANSAKALFDFYPNLLSCTELVGLSHYLAGAPLQTYATPLILHTSSNFRFIADVYYRW